MATPFKENHLPLEDLEKIGLFKNGKILLEKEDIDALLSGRRTELVNLYNLKADGFVIEQLDAKLSIELDLEHKVILRIHPVYIEPQLHPLLLPHEAELLQNGKIGNLQKTYQDGGQQKALQFEYDPETREFLSYDPAKVSAPLTVNGETLTNKQKQDFRNGSLVKLADGTKLQYRAADRKGVLSDRPVLVLSVLFEGGISYLLIRGIRNLFNKHEPQKIEQTKGFTEAMKELDDQLKEHKRNQNRQRETGLSEQLGLEVHRKITAL